MKFWLIRTLSYRLCFPATFDNLSCSIWQHTYVVAIFFVDGSIFCYTRHEPVGVCGQIIPVSLFSFYIHSHKRKSGGGRGLQPLLVGQKYVTFRHFPERTIGNLVNISDCSPNRLTHSGRNFTAPLNLKPSYAYVQSPRIAPSIP